MFSNRKRQAMKCSPFKIVSFFVFNILLVAVIETEFASKRYLTYSVVAILQKITP